MRCRIRKSGRHNSFGPLFCTIVLVESTLGAHQHSQEPSRSNCGLFSAREFQFSCRKTIYHTRLMDPLMHVSNDRQSRLRRQSSIYFQLFICHFNPLHSLQVSSPINLSFPACFIDELLLLCTPCNSVISRQLLRHPPHDPDFGSNGLRSDKCGIRNLESVIHQSINIRH